MIAVTGRPRRFCSDSCRVAAWRQGKRGRGRLAALHSSATDEWATPQETFDVAAAELGPFDLDVCATEENAKCASYFTRANDGLAQEWTGRVWMNPPYGRLGGGIAAWMRKAWEASQTTSELVVCLVPARTDTARWHEYAACGEVRFLRGRLRFGDAVNAAPFPSALVVFRNGRSVTELPAERAA
jgi:phage N-6-adenine-methyltransferase